LEREFDETSGKLQPLGYRPMGPDVAEVSASRLANGSVTKARDVIATRLKFETKPSFNPHPHLTHPTIRRGFEDPETIRIPSPPPTPCGKNQGDSE
jgi:hypothetical protein